MEHIGAYLSAIALLFLTFAAPVIVISIGAILVIKKYYVIRRKIVLEFPKLDRWSTIVLSTIFICSCLWFLRIFLALKGLW